MPKRQLLITLQIMFLYFKNSLKVKKGPRIMVKKIIIGLVNKATLQE